MGFDQYHEPPRGVVFPRLACRRPVPPRYQDDGSSFRLSDVVFSRGAKAVSGPERSVSCSGERMLDFSLHGDSR